MQGFFQKMKGVRKTEPNLPTNKLQSKDAFTQLVLQWKKTKNPQLTKQVVAQLKPTIDSALHTYTPGQENNFKVKAVKIALNSLQNYDSTKNTSPNTFVFTNLQRLNRLRRQRQNIIHISQSQVYLKQQVDKKIEELTEDLGRQPTEAQISDATGMSSKKLQKLKGFSTFSQSSSINPQNNQSTFGISDITEKDCYNYLYASVGDVDKKILQWSMPYNGKVKSNNQIAKALHLSPGAISQRKARLLQMLGEIKGLL